ncbi:MAG: phenylalanine--tRNA ligase subunit beta, partial [Patescibacteria group bacterium]
MRVSHKALIELVPSAGKLSADELLEQLRSLGFESELLEGASLVYEIYVTPNRGDALSLLGIARDLQARIHRASTKTTLRLKDVAAISALPDAAQPTVALHGDDCTQYHGVVFEHVTIQASPAWLQEELALLGLRPINNIVDLTNYLMERYGQPLHAFDLDAILGGEMTLRPAKQGEVLKTLDGMQRTLDKGTLIIQDSEAPIDLAGIMGGANTAIDHRTKRIFLQSALFTPASIKRSIAATKHTSAAAHRYARGVDRELSLPVLSEAITLLKKKEFGSNKATGKLIARTDEANMSAIHLDFERVNRLLGTSIPKNEQLQVLERIGCLIDDSKLPAIRVTPPSWRHDLLHWQDLAEEVIRITGLNEGLPAKRLPKATPSETRSDIEWAEGVKDRLVELGFSEILTYSFVGKDDLHQFDLPKAGELANPLNPHLQYLRPSLLPGLAAAVGKNSYFEPVLLFEIGHVFLAKTEESRLGIAIASQKDSLENWIARIADAFGIDSSSIESGLVVKTLSKEQASHYTIRRLPV